MTEKVLAGRMRRAVVVVAIAGVGIAGWLAGSKSIAWQDVAAKGPQAWLAAASPQSSPPGFEDLVDRVKPTVVGVRARIEQDDSENEAGRGTSPDRSFGAPKDDDSDTPRGRVANSQGSGFFISSDGYVVTTNHVVEHGDRIEITTDDGGVRSAVLIGSDPKTDLALLKVEGGGEFPVARIAARPPRIGQWVIAVGNPFGLGGTVTAGIVSAGARDIKIAAYNDFVQIDAPVNQGNSGGPAFDINGEVVGVNSAIFSPTGGSVGIGFAIPAETVRTIAAELKDKGSVRRGWIGVEIQPITPDVAEALGLDKQTRGVVVAELQPDSPAAKAGIRPGDVIRTLGGEAVGDDRQIVKRVGRMAPGQSIDMGMLRNGEARTVKVTIGELPVSRGKAAASSGHQENAAGKETAAKANGAARLGLTLMPAESLGIHREGVVVTEVDPNGTAAETGVGIGDIILDVSGSAMKTPVDVARALRDARGQGKRVALARVRSNDATRYIAIPVS
jgi:serine protease Do